MSTGQAAFVWCLNAAFTFFVWAWVAERARTRSLIRYREDDIRDHKNYVAHAERMIAKLQSESLSNATPIQLRDAAWRHGYQLVPAIVAMRKDGES